MDSRRIGRLVRTVAKSVGTSVPTVTRIARRRRDPFKILASTVLSLRTKDEVTMGASTRLFKFASTPAELAKVPVRRIEKAIYPVGFYKTKARALKAIAKRLEGEYGGVVPDTVDELLKFKGVGRKTANLVVTLGYGKPGICVDTHVHRISNRWGLVETKTPDQTEFALRDTLPKKYWIVYNELLVSFGQQTCTPLSPWCSKCPLERDCPKIGVDKTR